MREDLTTVVSLLYLRSSYWSTVLRESSYLIGCFFEAASMSKFFGIFARRSVAISLRISS